MQVALRILLSAAIMAMSLGAESPATPIVLELFTSEGCSSCPPADSLLAQLDGKQLAAGLEVIALSEHVDYWDRLGWRDAFSSPIFSARQSEYGHSFKLEGIYTPQIVINGEAECLGSDAKAIATAMKEVAQNPHAAASIKRLPGEVVSIKVDKFPAGTHESDILLAVAEDGLSSNVLQGENRGRQLKHVGVVRSLTRLAKIDPKRDAGYSSEAKLNLKPEWNPNSLKFVLLVQDRENKRIVAAASTR